MCDENGSPELIFDSSGKRINSFMRSPFGLLVNEDDETVFVPLGYHGGIEDSVSGVVVIRGRPYDSHLGQWMTPDLTFLTADDPVDIRDPRRLFAYRFKNNDPVNNEEDLRMKAKVSSIDDWLRFFGMKPPADYLEENDDDNALFASVKVEQDIDFETRPSEWPKLHNGIAGAGPVLGPNVIIDVDTKEAIIKVWPLKGAGSIERKIAALINATILMEESLNSVDVFVPKNNSRENFMNAIGQSDDFLRWTRTDLSEEVFIISLDLSILKINFWIGFESVDDAKESKVLYQFMIMLDEAKK